LGFLSEELTEMSTTTTIIIITIIVIIIPGDRTVIKEESMKILKCKDVIT